MSYCNQSCSHHYATSGALMPGTSNKTTSNFDIFDIESFRGRTVLARPQIEDCLCLAARPPVHAAGAALAVWHPSSDDHWTSPGHR